MKGFARFLIFAVLVLGVGYSYLGWSLAGQDLVSWLVLAIPFLCILMLPLTVWGRDRREHVHVKEAIAHTAYAAMGVLTYVTVFSLLRDLVWLVSSYRAPSYLVIVASAIALILGAMVALMGPTIKKVEIKYPDLPSSLDGFKIAQITDLHVGGAITRKYVERVVRKTNSTGADMVALTGDIGDGDTVASRHGINPLAELLPRERVFYVSGNHEYYWNIEAWLKVFRELGARVLHNHSEIFQHNGARILVGGIPDKMGIQMEAGEKPDIRSAISGAAEADFKILLSHRPSAARPASALGFDLQLSGHTHGGQFFPWTLVVRAVHEFHQGLRRVDKMWIYVSHGTGTWGPPLRLGTTPEVTLVILRRG